MRRVAVAVCLPLLVAVLFGSWNTLNPSTSDEMFFDEHGDSALSLLQTSAKLHVEKHGDVQASKVHSPQPADWPEMPGEMPGDMPEMPAMTCEEQCAGTVCMNSRIGMNQQLSCMQACEIRKAGAGEAACGYLCDRNGGSGCHLEVDGFSANMCWYCNDWPNSTQAMKQSFWSNQDCVQGCSIPLAPPPPPSTTTTTTMSICEQQCAGTVCPNPRVGMNQQLSCAQACEFRLAGEDAATCGLKCHRNGGSGCHLTVDGYSASMCQYCSDWPNSTQAAKQSFWSNQDCILGCSVELPMAPLM